MTIRFDTFAADGRGWQAAFPSPEEVREAFSPAAVRELVDWVAAGTLAGRWCVLCLAYEAAGAFDPALHTHAAAAHQPLAWGAMLADPLPPAPAPERKPYTVSPWAPLVTRAGYEAGINRVQALIGAGDTYQVNYTFPLQARFHGDPLSWYLDLGTAQQAGYCAYLDLGRHQILSLSPELFFERAGSTITTRPMKGTIRRGRWTAEDDKLAAELAACPKNRAENIMIVDLLRNDLGRIARPDTVQVPRLFTVEALDQVFQMTSTVTAKCLPQTSLMDLLGALFPCGSVTGAPKIRTMEIIKALEPNPRGVYTGTIGLIKPGGDAVFNVPIRTVVLDTETGSATFGVGGGITADSTATGEYDECQMKAAFLHTPRPTFELLESLRLENGTYWLLDQHLARVRSSATYFGFACDPARLEEGLNALRHQYPGGDYKVRMLVDRQGDVTLQASPLTTTKKPWRVALADQPVDATDRFLHHKTTHRVVYDQALQKRPDCDDVLLWNQEGELTESCRANLVLTIDGQPCTPPCTCGLLPGTCRADLLTQGKLVERTLYREDLERADAIRLINSVRGWIETEWCQ